MYTTFGVKLNTPTMGRVRRRDAVHVGRRSICPEVGVGHTVAADDVQLLLHQQEGGADLPESEAEVSRPHSAGRLAPGRDLPSQDS